MINFAQPFFIGFLFCQSRKLFQSFIVLFCLYKASAILKAASNEFAFFIGSFTIFHLSLFEILFFE